MDQLPPDPYLALGVPKTCQLAEIRSAHRKLVLKCHPDKVQDEALKAIKQDEFQKVQQAYELLSDENKRAQYDAQVKLFKLRKEMGRGPGPAPNVYYAEPRTTTYTPKSRTQAYPRHESDEARYTTPRRSTSYETKPPKSSTKHDERRKRKDDERLDELRRQLERRQLEREMKRKEEAANSERKKSRDKERRKAADEKPRDRYPSIETESDSEDFRKPSTSRSTRTKLADLVDMATKAHREDRRPDIIETAERRREKTKANIQNAYRYMNAAGRGPEPPRGAKPPIPDSPVVDTIAEEEETMQFSGGRTTRRPSAETSSRRTQDSSRSRESPRQSSKDKKRSEDVELPIRAKPGLFSQKSAPQEVLSTREKLHRAHTTDEKHASKSASIPTTLPRATKFHGNEQPKSRSVPRQQAVYESVSESSSESDSEVYVKKYVPPRERPSMVKTSSYKIVRDVNGQRAAERVRPDLGYVYEVPGAEAPEVRHAANYPRPSRPAASRPSQTQSYYDPTTSNAFARPPSVEPQRAMPNVKTVRPGLREAQSSWSRSKPVAVYGDVKVEYAPKIGREDITYSKNFMKGSDPNYPAPNAAHRREEIFPRRAMYAG